MGRGDQKIHPESDENTTSSSSWSLLPNHTRWCEISEDMTIKFFDPISWAWLHEFTFLQGITAACRDDFSTFPAGGPLKLVSVCKDGDRAIFEVHSAALYANAAQPQMQRLRVHSSESQCFAKVLELNPSKRRRVWMATTEGESDGKGAGRAASKPLCRFCYEGPDAARGELVSPCLCRGSQQYVHKCCMAEWMSYSRAHRAAGESVEISRAPDQSDWRQQQQRWRSLMPWSTAVGIAQTAASGTTTVEKQHSSAARVTCPVCCATLSHLS